MRVLTPISFLVTNAVVCLALGLTPGADAPAKPEGPPVRKAHGVEKRVPWTTSRVMGTPDPPSPYRVELAFPKLRFQEPLEIVTSPAGDRFFVLERYGKIYSFAADPVTEKADLLMDLGKTAYGFALHPRFKENGYLYVVYVLDPVAVLPLGSRIARFQVDPANPLRCDLATEKIIFEWPSGGHNGGCLRFGPDGYLYLSAGDGSGFGDELGTGQDLSDVLGSILRLDVDRSEAGRAYGIPRDNPFVGVAGARPEIWAYGLRQAWRINFDRVTGELWAGEIGQDLWETVHVIQKGGNYGWSVQEGSHPFHPTRKLGPTPILPPLVEHPHTDFRSITGGFVYRGHRLADLQGAYIYGDFDTGRVWALRRQGGKVTWHKELADTALRIVAFAEDREGELYLLDFVGGIYRIVLNQRPAQLTEFPRKLSETGLFASASKNLPAPGLIPYSVNSALWSDGAFKERFIALPGESQIGFDAVTYPQPAPGAPFGWRFPSGTVFVKTFSLEMEGGNPASRRLIETRLLHSEEVTGTEEFGNQNWLGYSYIWNDEQTDAVLVEAPGLDREYAIKDSRAEGGQRRQKWHFPSRAECTLCHTMSAKFILGVNTPQMNRDHNYGGVVANQLRTLEHLGVFTKPLPAPPEELKRLVDHEDESEALDLRARSYLHSNCSHCHRKWGGGNSGFQLLAALPLTETGTLEAPPMHGDFGIAGARIVVPGAPERSVLHHRMTLLGLGRMPHVASSVVDEVGVRLIDRWIKQLPKAKGSD